MKFLSLKLTYCIALSVIFSQNFTTIAHAAPLTLAENGKSSFTIVIPDDAPSVLRDAAQELQRCMTLATGVSLPIVQDTAATTGQIISLGSTKQAEKAGISTKDIALEGYRIVTRANNLYIIGPDTADGKRTPNGGLSRGSTNGIHYFLEKYLGVRWLLPGDSGRDVPETKTFRINDIDQTDAPHFISRRFPYVAIDGINKPEIGVWLTRQRMGTSFRIDHFHNWEKTVPKSMYKDHPDWFPMIDGKRPEPQGQEYKLETTNPELVQHFAKKAIEAANADPTAAFSLSPSDGFGWSQSPESLALYDTDPVGKQSVTPLILKFYTDVSNAVAAHNPDYRLSGYIYNDYLYPPSKGELKLPPNFYPSLAGSVSYGFRLVRPEVRERYKYLLQEWSKTSPHLFYYDLPDTFSPWNKGHGTILLTFPEMLNFIFANLTENDIKGLYIYGTADWGYGALTNYMWTKLMWDPKLDAYDIQKDWLNRAYGNEAGPVMNDLYLNLEKWFTEFYTVNSPHGHYNNALVKGFYGVRYAEIEKSILQAKKESMTNAQRQRFQLIENNIIALQWRLRNDKILPANYKSELTQTTADILKMVTTDHPDFNVFPNYLNIGPRPQKRNVTIAPPLAHGAPKKSSFPVRGVNILLLMTEKDGPVTINPTWANPENAPLTYSIKDASDKTYSVGILEAKKPIVFQAKANQPYYFYVSGGVTLVEAEGAAMAYGTNLGKGNTNRFHTFVRPGTMYFYVPPQTTDWKFTFSTQIPRETAKITLWSPDGKQQASEETGEKGAHSLTLPGITGFWKIQVDQASTAKMEDVYIVFDEKLPQWVSLDPQRPLIIE